MIKFESLVKNHSLAAADKLYNSNALCGEVGEVANIIKKMEIRKRIHPDKITSMKSMNNYELNLKEELGDVLFYLIRVALDNDLHIKDLVNSQTNKLNKQDKEFNRTFLK